MKKIAVKFSVLLVLFLNFSLQCFSQKDDLFLITTQNDTLYYNHKNMRYGKREVKIKQSEGKKILKVDNIKSIQVYGLKDKIITLYHIYVPARFADVWVQHIISGKINLYVDVQRLPTGGNSFVYYAAKEMGEPKRVSSRNALSLSEEEHIQSLAEMLSDNKELYNKFLAEKSDKAEIVMQYINLYNK